jgi:GNAT superfamily N-acetyltransferase
MHGASVDGEPVGTAGLIASDLSSRPDLTPWLAAMYVRPDARGRGYATDLIRAVEGAARVAGFDRIWLYTFEAEGLYLKAGWQPVEQIEHNGRPATLMRRDLKS